MARRDSRSALARAIGRGSARSGAEHWWAERVSAIALVPLSIWLVACLIAHMGGDYARTIQWLRLPSTVIVMILLLIALFHHTALGLQVIIEDYVHSGMKFAALVAMKLACAALSVAGIVAVLVIAFGS
jgi:succinate dehydrogenase / fumarate reductase membrane anchor subunit